MNEIKIWKFIDIFIISGILLYNSTIVVNKESMNIFFTNSVNIVSCILWIILLLSSYSPDLYFGCVPILELDIQ